MPTPTFSQAVILAAGKSTRTLPLTAVTPKAMLTVAGQSIISRTLSALPPTIREVIIVAGHGEQLLREHVRSLRPKQKIVWVRQREQNGTGGALRAAKKSIRGTVLVINGDDLYAPEDVAAMAQQTGAAVLGQPVKDPRLYGILQSRGSRLQRIVEKPQKAIAGLANIGCYVLPAEVLPFLEKIPVSPRGELEITDVVSAFAQKHSVKIVRAKGQWMPIGFPWDLLTAQQEYLKKLQTKIEGEVHPQAVIEGNVVVGRGTKVLSGVVIQGPAFIGRDCFIGPNCFIRGGSSIGDGCHIGQATEIKGSILGNTVRAGHLSYIGDSVVMDGVNFGAGTITANLRHDFKTIRAITVKGQVDSGRNKLGAFIGMAARTGIHTTLASGVMLGACSWTDGGEVLRENVPNFRCRGKLLAWPKILPSLADARIDASTQKALANLYTHEAAK